MARPGPLTSGEFVHCAPPRRRHLPWRIARTFFLAAALGAMAEGVVAQASLAAEDMIDEVPVVIGGAQESFTVVRDAFRAEQWYYVPDRPRLFERARPDGVREPDFTLIRYQFADPDDPEGFVEGGLLQFAMSLALPPEAIPQLKEAIAAHTGVAVDQIGLAALPFDATSAHLYVPESGELIASEPQGPGIAPTFATQKIAYSIPLTRIGSDVLDALVTGNTGIAVGVEFTYNGLSPAAGIEVTVDWDQTYEHYSRDRQFAARAGFAGYFGARANVSKQEIYDELVRNRAIEVEITEGAGFGQEEIARYLDPVLNRINQEILEDLKPPEQVEPAEAGDPDSGGWLDSLKGRLFGGAGYTVAIKDRRDVRQGTETFSLRSRMHQQRRTIASGFLGIGDYPPEMQERLVTVVPPGPWRSAFFILPNIGDAEEIGIRQVDLQIRLQQGDASLQTQAVRWTPQAGWTGRTGSERMVVAFGLLGVVQVGAGAPDLSFETTAQITLGRDVLTIDQIVPVDDERAIATPLAMATVVHVDGSLLSWQALEPESELLSVSVGLRSGSRSFSAQVRPRRVENQLLPPLATYWILERPSEAVVADIQFRLADGSTVPWPRNGEDLSAGQEGAADLFIELIDPDWRGRPGGGG